MICENSGSEIKEIEADLFDYQGIDYWTEFHIEEVPENAVYADLPTSWTGDELDETELPDCIRCPRCRKFPFRSKEVQTYHLVRVVMFKHRPKEENDGDISS